MSVKTWYEAVAAPVDPDMSRCKVCGLKHEQLPPLLRLVRGNPPEMACRHVFGIPATNVPDFATHQPDGTPYE